MREASRRDHDCASLSDFVTEEESMLRLARLIGGARCLFAREIDYFNMLRFNFTTHGEGARRAACAGAAGAAADLGMGAER